MTTEKLSTISLTKVSVVLLSDSNNPRLINPDFLRIHKIVPKDWVEKDIIVTPPIAQVRYENNSLIQVEENKITIETSSPDLINWQQYLPSAAIMFMDVLPRVNYRSVGLNFICNIPSLSSDLGYIADNFLADKEWRNCRGGLSKIGLTLYFANTSPQLNIKIEPGKLQSSNVYMCAGNFHNEFEPAQIKERKEYINTLKDMYEEYIKVLNELPLK